MPIVLYTFVRMTAKEALQHIFDTCPKNQLWYWVTDDEKERTWLRVTALRILNGTSKVDTMVRFFDMLGYDSGFSVNKRMEVKKR